MYHTLLVVVGILGIVLWIFSAGHIQPHPLYTMWDVSYWVGVAMMVVGLIRLVVF